MSSGSHGYSFPVKSPDPVSGITQVLIVCHANQCRSPYAEAIARQIAGDAPVRFASGGLISGGRPMPEVGRRLAASLGFDFDSHRSREVDLHDFGRFDLILTMARDQARELVAADPEAWPRIFTLKQFARWIAENPRPRRAALGSWLDAAAADRPRTSVIGVSNDDDIADPLRLPEGAWRRMVAELEEHLTTIVRGLEG